MKTLLYLPFILLFFQSCDNTTFVAEPFDPRLPVYSSEGRNTMGAYVNGEIVKDIDDSCSLTYGCHPKLYESKIVDTVRFDFGFSFHFKLVDDEFSEVEDALPFARGKIYTFGAENSASYHGENAIEGIIRFDNSGGNIISGTFYFITDTYEVTSGRFDYMYEDN